MYRASVLSVKMADCRWYMKSIENSPGELKVTGEKLYMVRDLILGRRCTQH